MNRFIAPPAILSAMAFRAENDNYLRPGVHLRIFAGMGASFPVTPFIVCRVKGYRGERVDVRLATHPGLPNRSGSVAPIHDHQPVHLSFESTGGDIGAISMLDSLGTRMIATRSRGPWEFSLPEWRWVSVRGGARSLTATTLNAPAEALDHGELGQKVCCLSLPGEPDRHYPWYLGWEKESEKELRVGEGWPRVWGPREKHVFGRWKLGNNGSFDRLAAPVADPAPTAGNQAQEELARVRKLLSYGPPHLSDVVRTMLETKQPPWEQILSIDAGGKESAWYNPLQMLQLGMGDCGVARHFGYAKTWPDDKLPREDEDLLAVYAIVVFDPKRIPEADQGMLRYSVARRLETQENNLLEEKILEALADDGVANDVASELQRIKDYAAQLGLMVAPFVTYTAAVEPYDPPSVLVPQVLRRQWAAPEGNTPSDKYSAMFAFSNLPMSTLALLERQFGNEFLPRSGSTLDDGADAHKNWLKPNMFGLEIETDSRRKELNLSNLDSRAGVLSDVAIPAEAAATYRASASDAFGRFGPAVVFEAQAPERPKPTAPQLNCQFTKATPAPTGEGSASPGVLTITACFDYDNDHMPASHEVAVPSVTQSPRGALQIEVLELNFNGTLEEFERPGQQFPLPALPPVQLTRNNPSAQLTIPGLPPMGKARLKLTGVYIDTAGTRSPQESTMEMSVTDVRAPRPLETGKGLVWTTRPSAAPEVTLDLVWDAPEGSEHVLYLGDERTLMQMPDKASRGERGAKLCTEAKHHDKTKYQRITPTAIKATAQNQVTYSLRLPRSLESVQVLRVVPLGPDGAEPNFDDCTTIPVAVPSSRRAPPPLLIPVDKVDETTGKAKLKVRIDGINLDELRREQPGLFDPAKKGKELPRFRLRCSSGKVSHPIYAQVQPATQGDDGAMPLELMEGDRFEAIVETKPLLPYVRYVYWAEVRLPPERCVPANLEQVPSGVRAVHAESTQPSERLWGELSAPLVLMHTPPVQQFSAGDVSLQILNNGQQRPQIHLTLTDPPKKLAKAVDTFKLAVWYRWGDGALAPVLDGSGASLDGKWPDVWNLPDMFVEQAPSLGLSLNVHIGLIDPIGRLGPITVLSA